MLSLAVLALSTATAAAAQQPPTSSPGPAATRPGVGDTSVFRPLELPSPNGYRAGSGAPGALYWQQKADYDIRASLDPATHTIRGEETIRYTNNSPDTLRYVWLQLDMNQGVPLGRMTSVFQPTGRVEPGFTPGATIERVNALRSARAGAAPAATPLTWREHMTMMRVDLDRPLPPRGVVSLDIAWHHQAPRNGRGGRESFPEGWLYNIAQWYPRLAVYDDVQGWNTQQYLGNSEFYLEYGDFDFAITAPATFTVTGTGVLRNAVEVLAPAQRARLAAAARSDTVIHIIAPGEVGAAALLPAGAGATRTWRFHADNVRDVAWAAAPHFLWDALNENGVLIQALYPPQALPVWSRAADMGRHAIREYSRRLLPYPYPTAINVNGPVGGMEYPMIVFCQEREDEKELFVVTAHEFGHEWYPMIVGSNERLYGWMDEGFNTFINLFPYQLRYPGDTVRTLGLDFGPVRAWAGYLRQYAGRESPIIEATDRNPGPLGGWLSYGKPGVALHFLRNEVVDSAAFDGAFREYTRRWAFRHPTPADFFRSMNDALGEDLSWFWRSWFLRTDHLDQAVDTVIQRDDAAGTVTSRIVLSSRREMVAPVEFRVTGADGGTRVVKLPVEVWYGGGRFTYPMVTPAASRPVRVEIDPRQVYPDVVRSNNVWNGTP